MRHHTRTLAPRHLARVALAATAGALLLAGAASAADPGPTVLAQSPWPMYGRDPKHTFRSPLLGPATNNQLEPTRIGAIFINSQPAVAADGQMVVSAGFATWGLRPDGVINWRSNAGDAKFSSPALDSQGFTYFGERGNQLWKKSSETGDAICKRYIKSDSDIKASPTISVKFPNRVYAPSAARLYAIRTSGGTECEIIWELQLDDVTMSSVSLADTVPGNGDSRGDLVMTAARQIYRIRDDGPSATIVATAPTSGYVQGSTPLIHPTTGNIFVGNQDRGYDAFRPDLSPLWSVDVSGRVMGSSALSPDGQTIYFGDTTGELHALSVTNGSERPGFPFDIGRSFSARVYAPVVDGAGVIYAGGEDRKIHAINPDGSQRWEARLGGQPGPAVIVPGGLIVPAWDGRIYRFCPPPTGPATATKVCGFTVDTTAPVSLTRR